MIEIGTLCIVRASGCNFLAVARHLVVVIDRDRDELLRTTYTVRPIQRRYGLLRDSVRMEPELVTLAQHGMRIAWIRNFRPGVDELTVERDPAPEPLPDAKWGNPNHLPGMTYLDNRTFIESDALPFIRVPQPCQEAA